MPDRDTTGCAAHINLENCIDSSITELLERQCLLRFWLTAQPNAEISLSCIEGVEISDYVKNLIKKFSGSGDLSVYDISFPGIPGFATLSVFGTEDKDARVKYSAGLSYSWSAKSSLEKSILELWQCFIFLHYFDVSDYKVSEVDDPYHRHFWKCNKYSTYLSFTSVFNSNVCSLKSYISQERASTAIALAALEKITNNVYLYISSDSVRNKKIWYTKVFSPDLYLHMNFSGRVNHDNSLSSLYSIAKPNRMSKMAPFP